MKFIFPRDILQHILVPPCAFSFLSYCIKKVQASISPTFIILFSFALCFKSKLLYDTIKINYQKNKKTKSYILKPPILTMMIRLSSTTHPSNFYQSLFSSSVLYMLLLVTCILWISTGPRTTFKKNCFILSQCAQLTFSQSSMFYCSLGYSKVQIISPRL